MSTSKTKKMLKPVKLRDYQQNIAVKIHDAWGRVMAVLAVLATGGGKTVIFSAIIHGHNGASAAVVHRREILGQISCSLAQLGVKHRIVAPPATVALIRRKHLKKFSKSYVDPHARCGVISVQTLTSKSAKNNAELMRWVKQVTLCVFDEGHHYVSTGLWGRAVEMVENAKLLFVTATPERADGKGLGKHADGYAEEMVEGPTMRWLIDHGYLSKYTYKAPKSDLNVDDIPLTASGELNSKVLRQRVTESHLVGDVVAQYRKFADGKKAIVFADSVATAEEMAAAFRAAGYDAEALSGESDDKHRDRQLDGFEFGSLQVLINCELFDEGFDVPGVECVITARPTESLSKFLQMIGRGLRPVYAEGFDLKTKAGRLAAMAAGSKPEAVVLDPVRNWERHGMPHWPREWTLNAKVKGSRGQSDTIPQRVCLSCTQPYEKYFTACPYCGEPVPEPAGRSAPEQVDGDLFELDLAAMDALFEKMGKADMSDEDYAHDQIARNIPPIGRRQDMKRHQTARHRREVLRHLVGWWVGAQPGRELSEIHRRFFYRFGVDIGTPFTKAYGAKDVNALIVKITENFDKDADYGKQEKTR